jgi:hypothetical protein
MKSSFAIIAVLVLSGAGLAARPVSAADSRTDNINAVPASAAGYNSVPTAATDRVTNIPYGAAGYHYKQVSKGKEPSGWQSPSFNDSEWGTGAAPFGSGHYGCSVDPTVKTHWALNTTMLVRKQLSLPAAPVE